MQVLKPKILRDFKKYYNRDELSDERIKVLIPEEASIRIYRGREFKHWNMCVVGEVPNTDRFTTFKFTNPETKRKIKIYKCDFY